ncbi:MAG TPA: hypothetical protein VEA61_02690 [Allosphingosinicella sp.]|nr:hypothetical protein [Allosphingosinicella sp.]
MIPMMLLQVAAAPTAVPVATPDPSFFSGRFECRVVDEATNVSSLAFDYREKSVAVVDGGRFARAGTSVKANSTIGQVGPLKVRQTSFETDSSGVRRIFELAEMIGTGYRANRLVVLTQSGGLKGAGKGLVMAVSQLTAIGMCKAAPQQDRR